MSAASGCGVRRDNHPTGSASVPIAASAVPINRIPAVIAFFDDKNGLGISASGPSDEPGRIWQTRDGGATWTAGELPGVTLRVITVIPGSGRAWAGAACGEDDSPCRPGIVASTDRGVTWERISDEPVVSLSFADPAHGWAASPREPSITGPVGGVAGSLLATNDGGHTWSNRGNPCRSIGMAPMTISFPDVQHGWIGCGGEGGLQSSAKAVIETADGGRTWRVQSLVDLPGGRASVGEITYGGYLTQIAMRSGGVGFASMSISGSFRTRDDGRVWTSAPPGSDDGGQIVSSVSLPTDTAWFASLLDSQDGTIKLELSRDEGATWRIVSQRPNG
jgi:photosystem II stability/assembly factor-like uncharacterized protein